MQEMFMAIGAGLVVSLWNKYIVPRLPSCAGHNGDESDSDNSATMASSDVVHHDFSL